MREEPYRVTISTARRLTTPWASRGDRAWSAREPVRPAPRDHFGIDWFQSERRPGSSTVGAAAAPVPPTAAVTLQGAGATFPPLLYANLVPDLQRPLPEHQDRLHAEWLGRRDHGHHAADRRLRRLRRADEGHRDRALPAGKKLFHFPTALGAVVAIYNLPNVAKVQLDGPTLAGIYLGKITKWNDPALAAINAGVTLPDLAILVVHRSDGSGTTNAFTTYLDKVDPTWHAGPGAGKTVNWPTGVGASGNDGVATGVKQTPGAIGYVDLSVAISTKLTSAYLKNADGNFVAGSTDGVTAAAEAVVSQFPPTSARGRSSTAPARRPTRSRPTPTCSSTRTRPTRPRARPSSRSSTGP